MQENTWKEIVEACQTSKQACRKTIQALFRSQCEDETLCEKPRRTRVQEKYSWIEKIIQTGVPDGRSRLILYVISRYLLNIKKLDIQESHETIKTFLENSCKNHGNCSKIYDSWIRNVLTHVQKGGWKPWTLEKIQKEDPQLYNTITTLINQTQK